MTWDKLHILYSKACLKRQLSKTVFKTNYPLMQVQGEHSAILSTFIKLPVIKIFVLSFLSGCLRQVLLYVSRGHSWRANGLGMKQFANIPLTCLPKAPKIKNQLNVKVLGRESKIRRYKKELRIYSHYIMYTF